VHRKLEMTEKKTPPAKRTPVVIRTWRGQECDGELLALFPTQPADPQGRCMSYDKHGHSAADYFHCVSKSRPATPEEQTTMLGMLDRVGYENLRVIKRASYSHHKQRAAEARKLRKAECPNTSK